MCRNSENLKRKPRLSVGAICIIAPGRTNVCISSSCASTPEAESAGYPPKPRE